MLIDQAWGEEHHLTVPGDEEETITFCADHFLSVAEEAVLDHGAFFVALSGGSTPRRLFQKLTQDPYQKRLPWSHTHLFWSDERAAGPSDPESNYHMAMEAGLKRMPIPPSQIHRMVAEVNIEENARNYEAMIQKTLTSRHFDLVMLGMGDDGHTASLFPGTEGLNIEDRLIIANFIPQKNCYRMTMTFRCINSASHIAIYVLGSAKQKMLKEALTTSDRYPIQKVGTSLHKVLWIADKAAAALLF